MNKHKLVAIVIVALGVASCSSEPRFVEATVEVLVAREVTKIVEVTQVIEVPVEVTRLVEVIVTPVATSTPIATQTPAGPTNTPTGTPDPTTKSRGNGFYLIGINIAPGLWRSEAGHTSCYWERSTDTGEIIDNHFGDSGGTVRLQSSDFQVEFGDCGTWEYLGP